MSRLDDLTDLIQTTNEVYFISAPGRVRTAFVLADDIVELALKTFLQEKALEQREQFTTKLEQADLVTSRAHRVALDEHFVGKITLDELSNKLKLDADGESQLKGGENDLRDPYNRALEQFSRLRIDKWSANFEHSVLHTISPDFFLALREQLREAVARLQSRVKQVDEMRSPTARQRADREIKSRQLALPSQQLSDIESLIGP